MSGDMRTDRIQARALETEDMAEIQSMWPHWEERQGD